MIHGIPSPVSRRLTGAFALSLLLTLGCTALRGAPGHQAQPDELRAIQLSSLLRSELMPSEQPRKELRELFDRIAAANFNAIIWQMRSQGYAIYPSLIEPPYGGKAQTDLTAIALEEARKRNLRMFASVSLLRVGLVHKDTESSHVLGAHGANSREPWVCMNNEGKPISIVGAATWLNPALPEVQTYLRSVVGEIVDKYPQFDGVCLTDACYPSRTVSQPPSVRKRYTTRANPNLSVFEDWEREQLTRLVGDIRAEIATRKPAMSLIASVSPIYHDDVIDTGPVVHSGFRDHLEDSVAWLRSGAVDLLIPDLCNVSGFPTEPRDSAPLTVFTDRIKDWIDSVGKDRVAAGIWIGNMIPAPVRSNTHDMESMTASADRVKAARDLGVGIVALGHSFMSAPEWEYVGEKIFPAKAAFPGIESPLVESGIVTGTVIDEAGKPVMDAVVRAEGARRRTISGADGFFSFPSVRPGTVGVRAEFDGAPPASTEVTVKENSVAAAELRLAGVEKAAAEPVFFMILDPDNWPMTTPQPFANILGRSPEATKVTIGGEEAPLYSTGIFVRDRVPLSPGENEIKVVVTGKDGKSSERTIRIERADRGEERRGMRGRGRGRAQGAESPVTPSQDVMLAGGEDIELSCRAAAGSTVECLLPNGRWVKLGETADSGGIRSEVTYRATTAIASGDDIESRPLQFRIKGPEGRSIIESKGRVGVWGPGTVRLAVVKEDGTGLAFGLHEVRLGGPYLAEVTSGTILRITGQRGPNYHVRLSGDMDAWVPANRVEWADPSTAVPHLAFSNLSVYGDDQYDLVSIPYGERVPFAVTPVVAPGGNAALDVEFYGAHSAATWISHRPTATVIREATVEQVASDRVRVRIELKIRQLWGYKFDLVGSSLRISVRRPPALAAAPDSPLKGMTVALEAGHGGMGSGAIGVSGFPEKEINRMTMEALADELTSAGAKVVITRKEDEGISLGARSQRAIDSNADLFISIHANAAGQDRGYLRVSGTSTYYKYPFCRDLSEAIHARLLEHTQLGDFGNVGNFNYYPLRAITWMPTMLVEQAFMSNPEDEAKMLDPAFRASMARAVREGMEDFLRGVATPEGGK